jgi:predicted DNA-binding transcriptional regulator AlpA
MEQQKILTKQEAASQLRVSTRTLDRLIATDAGLKRVQISLRRVGVLASSVDAYIARCAEAA